MFIEPVFGKGFFGREEILGTLNKRVTALKGGYRQNLALTGPMLCGKSSILRHFLKGIQDPEIVPIYIDMTEEDFPVFARRFIATLLYNHLNSSGNMHAEAPASGRDILPNNSGSNEEHFDRLCLVARDLIPETFRCIEKIRKEIKNRKFDIAYEGILALTSVFKTETGKNCIVILDEFHNLSNFKIKKPFRTFGKFIMVQKSTMYIVSSSQQTLLRDILSKKLSLLFGNFEVLEIKGFDNHASRSFISDKLRDIDRDGTVTDYIVQLSQGNPFYLEAIAGNLCRIASKNVSVVNAKEHLLTALAEVFYDSAGILNQYFTNNINFFLEKKNRKKYIPVLVSLSRGNGTMKQIQKDIGRNDRELGQKLQKLVEMDLVWKSGIFYKMSDKLFEYWINYVYSVKTRSMIDDMDIKYLEFKSLMEEDYKRYRAFREKGAIEAISEIFSRFGGEKVCLGINPHRLPALKAISSESANKSVTRITGHADPGRWICHVKKNDIAEENEITDLIKYKSSDKGHKINRKIFIPLDGIEQNAFLLAKEHNIWVWDIDKINKIFRLYGRFELVL